MCIRDSKENMLGREGKGFNIAMQTLDGGRIGIAAQSLGIAEGALEEAKAYTKGRVQFGKPISKFQNTQFTFADMEMGCEAGRLLTYQAAVLKGTGVRCSKEAAMAKLGYRPNYAARALKHGKFKDVGVVLFNMLTYGNARILGGIADAANSNGYAITMQSFGRNRERTLHAAIERMKQLPVDGVIAVMEEHVTDFSEFRPPKELPVVIISEDPANYCPTIDADQYGCSAAVVDYLLSKGHKTVYHIAGPSSSRAAESRAQGWHDTLDQLGLRIPPTYMGDWEADSGYQAGLALAHDPDCTAIYAANDQMAYGAMLGLQAAGKRVPEDVSIVGVDDSLSGTIPRLSLTTMRMKFNDIGREAFFMTKRLCKGLRVPSGVKTVVPAELVERGSVRDLES